MLLDGAVQVGDVRLMVLVVVQLHGLGVDVRLQRRVVIGKRWKFVCQSNPPGENVGGCWKLPRGRAGHAGARSICVSDDTGCGRSSAGCKAGPTAPNPPENPQP